MRPTRPTWTFITTVPPPPPAPSTFSTAPPAPSTFSTAPPAPSTFSTAPSPPPTPPPLCYSPALLHPLVIPVLVLVLVLVQVLVLLLLLWCKRCRHKDSEECDESSLYSTVCYTCTTISPSRGPASRTEERMLRLNDARTDSGTRVRTNRTRT